MPTIPPDVCRVQVQLNSDLSGEISVWSWHMQRDHSAGEPVDWPNDLGPFAQKVEQRISTHKDELPFARVHVDHVSVYHLDAATGKTLDEAHVAPTDPIAWQGNPAPLMVTIPVHLYGYDPAGFDPKRRSKRGRMSLGPINQTLVGSQGLLSGSQRDGVAANMATFLNDINGMHIGEDIGGVTSSDNMRLGILSTKEHAFYRCVAIRVGDHFGAVHSRQNKIPVTYSTATINQS